MARNKAKQVDLEDLDSIAEQLEDLDLGEDEDLELEEDEEIDDDGSRGDVTVVELEDGTEVEITEDGLSALDKPKLLQVVAALNEDGYGIEVAKNAKKPGIIKAILAAESRQAEELVGTDAEEEDTTTEPQKTPKQQAKPATEPAPVQSQDTAAPSPQSYTHALRMVSTVEQRYQLVLAALDLRSHEVLESDLPTVAKQAAVEQIAHCKELVRLFLKPV